MRQFSRLVVGDVTNASGNEEMLRQKGVQVDILEDPEGIAFYAKYLEGKAGPGSGRLERSRRRTQSCRCEILTGGLKFFHQSLHDPTDHALEDELALLGRGPGGRHKAAGRRGELGVRRQDVIRWEK